MIKTTIDYVQAVREEIIFCDEFCNNLSKWLKAVNNDAPSAEEIKNRLQGLYDSCEGCAIRYLSELSDDDIADNNELIDYSLESNDGFNLKITILIDEKAKELVNLKVGLNFKS